MWVWTTIEPKGMPHATHLCETQLRAAEEEAANVLEAQELLCATGEKEGVGMSVCVCVRCAS